MLFLILSATAARAHAIVPMTNGLCVLSVAYIDNPAAKYVEKNAIAIFFPIDAPLSVTHEFRFNRAAAQSQPPCKAIGNAMRNLAKLFDDIKKNSKRKSA